MDMEPGISTDYLPMDPKRLLERFHTALNSHDLTNLLNLLQVDYEQSFPGQQRQGTIGLEQARSEWERLFNAFPDIRADLRARAIEGNQIWSEWHWTSGQDRATGPGELDQPDSDRLNQYGVIIFGVEEGLIAWGRFYMIDTH